MEGSDRLHEHLLELHFPLQLHLANHLIVSRLSEEIGCHFVSFQILPHMFPFFPMAMNDYFLVKVPTVYIRADYIFFINFTK